MSEPTPETPAVLNYRTPSSDKSPPTPVTAVLLCLPGAICWGIVGLLVVDLMYGMSSRPMLFVYLPLMARAGLLIATWLAAIITGFISLAKYLPRQKPWYVLINLIINICGLLFTAGIAAIIVSELLFHW